MTSVNLNTPRLEAILKEKDLSGNALAIAMGREQPLVWRILHTGTCSERTLYHLCKTLNIQIEDIVTLPARLTIGQSMWLQRVKHGLSVSDLAAMTREPQDKVRKIEGDKIDITVLEAVTFAEVLGITLDELLLFKPKGTA